MASKALRQIFIDAAQELLDQGKREEAGMMCVVVRASDRQERMSGGRKKGERVADRLKQKEPTD